MDTHQKLYEDLVETSQDLIWQCDREGKYVYLNPAWKETFGYDLTEMLGKKFTDFQSPAAASRDSGEFLRLMEGNDVKGYETVHIAKDGRDIHLVFNARVVRDETGAIVGTRGTAHDITVLKDTLDKLDRAQKFNETILAATPDIIYVYDIVEKRNVYSNEGIEAVLGYSVSDVKEMGESLIEILMHPEDFKVYAGETLPKYQVLPDNQFIQHEYRMKSKAGEWRWLRSRESIFLRQKDGSPKQIFGIISDISVQKRTEARIKKSEEAYRSLFNQMLDGCAHHEIICDDHGTPVDYRFLSMNPAFERLTGLKAENLIGRTVLEVLPETERHWIDTYGTVALTGEPVAFENYTQALDKHFKVTAYRPAENQFACIFHDITKRKKAEAERVKIEAQLRHTQKMEAIGTLAGGIAHDFNNILAAIIGFADMAKDDIPDYSPARLQIDEVLKAGNRAKNLVKQILAFSRKSDQHLTPVRICSIIDDAANFLRATIPATIDIRIDMDDGAGTILADGTQIHQILLNLCTNAAHAMEEDGGILSIALKSVERLNRELVNGAELPPGEYLCLSVSDTGEGIEKKNLQRIFDPYFTTKEVGKGSGMGLSVVHGIVKNHNGVIEVESVPRKGTAFHIYFPKVEDMAEEISIDAPEVPIGKEHILVIDDDTSIALLTKNRLVRLGYQVVVMTSIIEALDVFAVDPRAFHLIVTDQTMPQMTGEQLAGKLRQIRADIPIIMCTGYSSKIDAEKARGLGIDAFLMKPFEKEELARTVRHVLDEFYSKM